MDINKTDNNKYLDIFLNLDKFVLSIIINY